jgi:hypothetical protein
MKTKRKPFPQDLAVLEVIKNFDPSIKSLNPRNKESATISFEDLVKLLRMAYEKGAWGYTTSSRSPGSHWEGSR